MQIDGPFLAQHVQYSRWATMANLDAVAKLTQDELHRPMGDSFKGVLGTLVHMFRADRVWLRRLQGDVRFAMIPKGETFSTLEEVRTAWVTVFDELEAVIGGFSAEELEADIRFFSVVKQKELVVPRWQAILHMVNHASYHRGQITTLLLQMNHNPASTDLVFYYLRDQLG